MFALSPMYSHSWEFEIPKTPETAGTNILIDPRLNRRGRKGSNGIWRTFLMRERLLRGRAKQLP